MNKKDNNTNYKKKLKILDFAKKIIRNEGWSRDLFKKLTKSNVQNSDLIYLFPNGYTDLINFALNEINVSVEQKVKKINIINFSISKRIKKILYFRLQILEADKSFYKKTFNHLLIPQNSKIIKKNLYKSVDEMWYLAGDNSTDFSFYTKRLLLAVIYSNALFVLFQKNIDEAEINIDNNLKKISKIPKIKDRFSLIKDNLPFLLKGFLN